MEGDSQLVFVDTPGLFQPRRRLDRAMVAAAWGGAADADIVVLLIEAHRGLTEGTGRGGSPEAGVVMIPKDPSPATRIAFAIPEPGMGVPGGRFQLAALAP